MSLALSRATRGYAGGSIGRATRGYEYLKCKDMASGVSPFSYEKYRGLIEIRPVNFSIVEICQEWLAKVRCFMNTLTTKDYFGVAIDYGTESEAAYSWQGTIKLTDMESVVDFQFENIADVKEHCGGIEIK